MQPVAALFKFETEAEVIKKANSVPVGLSSYAFTRDLGRAWRISEALEVGMVGINGGIGSPSMPFGGVKHRFVARPRLPDGVQRLWACRRPLRP